MQSHCSAQSRPEHPISPLFFTPFFTAVVYGFGYSVYVKVTELNFSRHCIVCEVREAGTYQLLRNRILVLVTESLDMSPDT